ncbi:hypothetical protein INT47_005646 [Mucor saturninus]|uniref:Uncharacterized protein n=1 Tax=Mucor saturninus TaxID=64648 RepID=A0A8H7UZ47_9FUNG|nr:hypothetical protein INT47_005646 [Mucor saturninus]
MSSRKHSTRESERDDKHSSSSKHTSSSKHSGSSRHNSSSSSSKRGNGKRHHESDDEGSSSKREKRHLESVGLPASLKASIQPITEDAYFEKATEFRLWLKEHKHKYMDEISSKESRRYFKKFVDKWNHYELEAKFYQGLNSTQLSSSDTTRFKWGFAKSLDQSELDSVRDSVDSMTALSRGEDKLKRRANVGPSMPPPSMPVFKGDQRKYEQKKQKEMRQAILDEVAPRETGREAQIAKKRALNSYHKREPSPDVELSEADLMGVDDFKSRLAAERRAKEIRESRQNERREQRLAPIMDKMGEYKAKESATMAMFKKMAEEQRKNRG